MPAFAGIPVARWGALASGDGGLPTAAEWPTVALAVVVLVVAGVFALKLVGLSWLESSALSGLAPIAVLVDVPLGAAPSGTRLFANLAGCVLPVAIAVAVLATRRVPRIAVAVLLACGVALALFFSWVVPSRGVLLDYRACALGIGLASAALLHGAPRQAGALAFAAAAIGTTVGADLLRLDTLLNLPDAAAVTLGGAGLLDGILLTALVAAFVGAGGAAGVHAVTRFANRAHAPSRA